MALHAASPDPNNAEDEEYIVFSKGLEKEAPVEVNRYMSVPTSKLPETEALPDTLSLPPKTRSPEADAVVNSRILNWVDAAEKVQLPDIF